MTLTRRGLLQVGYSALLGMSCPSFVLGGWGSSRSGEKTPRVKSVLLIFLTGGASHIDTFDMKPDAPEQIRGEFRPIATCVPGIRYCEHLPRLAALADQLAIVRTMTHETREHMLATHFVLTGHNSQPAGTGGEGAEASRLDWPCYAAGLSYTGLKANDTPAGISLPKRLTENGRMWPGQDGGFLGPKHDPWQVNQELDVADSRIVTLKLPQGISVSQLADRQALLDEVNRQRRQLSSLAEATGLAMHQRQAFDMLRSAKIARAFDLQREPQKVRERYGWHTFGQSLLLARRLVEVGVPIIQANMGYVQTWDTHNRNFPQLRTLLPPLDMGVSALLEDLRGRRLLDETLVVMLGEFGRTPRVGHVFTSGGTPTGRDHWPHNFFAAFAGGGAQGGQTIGRSDKNAAFPDTRPYYPADVGATIYQSLGIDPQATIPGAFGDKARLNSGKVIDALFNGGQA